VPDSYEARIVGLLCNWCTYAGADLAGITRTKYPQNIRPIRIPCSGRVSPHFIFTALFHGADGVFVGGCHPADCHYNTGNYHARRRFSVIRSLLDFVGVEPERLALEWVSASEGDRFAEVVTRFTGQVKALGGPNPLARGKLED
jgi:F420-non-reducing hydrogenase iron-sulfur subunit